MDMFINPKECQLIFYKCPFPRSSLSVDSEWKPWSSFICFLVKNSSTGCGLPEQVPWPSALGGSRALKLGMKSQKHNGIFPGSKTLWRLLFNGIEDTLEASLHFLKWTHRTGQGVCGFGQLFLGGVGKPWRFWQFRWSVPRACWACEDDVSLLLQCGMDSRRLVFTRCLKVPCQETSSCFKKKINIFVHKGKGEMHFTITRMDVLCVV